MTFSSLSRMNSSSTFSSFTIPPICHQPSWASSPGITVRRLPVVRHALAGPRSRGGARDAGRRSAGVGNRRTKADRGGTRDLAPQSIP